MIKVYTTPVCSLCFVLKEFLKEKGVEFEEIDVSQDEKIRDEIIEKSNQMSIPVVEINGEIVVGFDRKKIVELLNIKD